MTTTIMKYCIPIAGRLIHTKSMHVPADLIVVCLWGVTGLIITALVGVGVGVGSEQLAGILTATE